jgi:hypothetical protein
MHCRGKANCTAILAYRKGLNESWTRQDWIENEVGLSGSYHGLPSSALKLQCSETGKDVCSTGSCSLLVVERIQHEQWLSA